MPTSPLSAVIRHLRADCGPDGGALADGELLARFLSSRDDRALAALVRRHAAMVWGVCGRLLANHHDADDAFQATFLVLIRKAAAVPRQAVANWLYGVARQTAVRLRASTAKRRRRETQVVNMPEPTVADVRDADLPAVLDEEIGRLPDHYRGVIVLCELEGMTRKQAAGQLGIPEGSVASRLARARAMLAKRLTRRGVVLSGERRGVSPPVAAPASAPPALVASTIKSASLLAAGRATGAVSAKVAALTEGVVRAMFLAKLKTVACVVAVALLVGLGGAAVLPGSSHQAAAGAATAPQKAGDAKPAPDARKLVRQLGSADFAKRDAAHQALTNMGARAAAAVRAGMADADAEIARRCVLIWPRLWQTEIARPDADRQAWSAHPLWARFRKAAGDDGGSRLLFAEMVADVNRFRRLEAVEADPDKAGAAYAAELKRRVEAMKRAYQKAEEAAQGRSGDLWPAGGIPSRGEFAALLFLGTYPSTATVSYPEAGDADRFSHHNVFGLGLRPDHREKAEVIPPAVRRLFVAWLGTRTDADPDQHWMYLALCSHIAEVLTFRTPAMRFM